MNWENINDCDEHFTKSLPGTPENWQPPCPPEGWTHVPDTKSGEPAFESLDNPACWCPYTFRAKFTSRGATGTYLHHEMPAGAHVIPRNAAGVRKVNGWTFHDQGRHHHLDNGDFWRKNATRDNIFPPDRKSKLDAELLKKMGLTRERMVSKDALFFFNYCFHSMTQSIQG